MASALPSCASSCFPCAVLLELPILATSGSAMVLAACFVGALVKDQHDCGVCVLASRVALRAYSSECLMSCHESLKRSTGTLAHGARWGDESSEQERHTTFLMECHVMLLPICHLPTRCTCEFPRRSARFSKTSHKQVQPERACHSSLRKALRNIKGVSEEHGDADRGDSSSRM